MPFVVFSPQKIFGGLPPFGYGDGNSISPAIVWQKFHENPFSRSRELLSHIYPASSWQTADRKNSQCFNRIVHRRLWVKVHEIFHTCRAPRGLFTVKV